MLEKAHVIINLLVEDHKILRLLFPGNGKSRDKKTIGSLQEAYFDNLAKIEELLPDKRIRDKAKEVFVKRFAKMRKRDGRAIIIRTFE